MSFVLERSEVIYHPVNSLNQSDPLGPTFRDKWSNKATVGVKITGFLDGVLCQIGAHTSSEENLATKLAFSTANALFEAVLNNPSDHRLGESYPVREYLLRWGASGTPSVAPLRE